MRRRGALKGEMIADCQRIRRYNDLYEAAREGARLRKRSSRPANPRVFCNWAASSIFDHGYLYSKALKNILKVK
jgi:hypothetical protein